MLTREGKRNRSRILDVNLISSASHVKALLSRNIFNMCILSHGPIEKFEPLASQEEKNSANILSLGPTCAGIMSVYFKNIFYNNNEDGCDVIF